MKKVLLLSIMALSLFALLGMGGNKEQAPNIAVIKAARLFQESQPGKDGMARLEQLQKDALAKLEAMQSDMQKAQDAKDEEKATRLQNEMQSLVMNLQNVLKAEQDVVVEKINAAMTKAMDDYRAKNGILAIFNDDTVLSLDNKIDATNAIMEIVNKQPVNFGPMPSLEAAKMPEIKGLDQAITPAPATPAEKPAQAPAEKPAAAPAEKPAQ